MGATKGSNAGFESILNSGSESSQGHFIDSWDDCHDCNYNCEESNWQLADYKRPRGWFYSLGRF